MSTYSRFKTDDNLEQAGVIIDLGDSGKFRIARAGGSNKKYQQRLEALMRPHRRLVQAGTLGNDIAETVMKNVIIDAILLGWDGVTGPDNKPLPFTRENAKKLLDDLPDLLTTIRDCALDATVFREDSEIDSGN